MKKSAIIVIIGVVLISIIGIMYVTTSNKEIKTKNLFTAQQTTCEAYFDKMWKVLQQQASVADQYKEAFKEIYPDLIEGRYSNGGGQLMQWVQEHNPEFDSSLYGKLMNSIEAQREGFFNEQRKLISINNEHRNLLELFPTSLFVGGRDTLNLVVITSLKTKNIYESGEENDIELF